MSEFQLYKKRDFSALMNDTMDFFKKFWKNYFRNYVVINGALILLMCVLYFIFFKDMFKNMYNPGAASAWMTDNMNPTNIIGGLFFFLISIVLLVFTIAYPMIYLKLLKTKGDVSLTSSEVFNGIKSYAGRLIVFGLISFFIMLPLSVIVFAICIALSIVIIGIPMLILSVPTIMIWTMQAVYVFIDEDESYFFALKKGWKITFEKYWHVVGSTIITSIFVAIVSSIFTMVPAIMMMSSVITTGGQPNPMELTPTILVFYIIGMIFSFLANNILFIQQGLIYYSSQENSVNYQAFSEIENIGTDEA